MESVTTRAMVEPPNWNKCDALMCWYEWFRLHSVTQVLDRWLDFHFLMLRIEQSRSRRIIQGCMSIPTCLWQLLFYNSLSLLSTLDSVEEGEKIVKTAIDNYGRIGQSLLADEFSCVIHSFVICVFLRHFDQQCRVRRRQCGWYPIIPERRGRLDESLCLLQYSSWQDVPSNDRGGLGWDSLSQSWLGGIN